MGIIEYILFGKEFPRTFLEILVDYSICLDYNMIRYQIMTRNLQLHIIYSYTIQQFCHAVPRIRFFGYSTDENPSTNTLPMIHRLEMG